MTDTIRTLLDEYTTRFRRGEHPDPLDYQARAGARWAELAARIDAHLRDATPPAPTPDGVATMRQFLSGTPPLLALRRRRGVPGSDVVHALMERLHIPEARRDKVTLRYRQLEAGLLALPAVTDEALDAIAAALDVDRREVYAWRALDAPTAARARAALAVGAHQGGPIRRPEPPGAHAGGGRADAPDEVDAHFGPGP
ncbi:MAG: hypothetical protein AB1416_00800 [Actinomycetota bacterium]